MPSSNNGPNPQRRPAPQRGIDLSSAYAKLGSGKRTGGTTHYRDPDVLERHPIPRGGELRLEALRPYLGGEPIVRWVAEYVDGEGAHCTTESYLQIPHHGFDVLEQPDAARLIANDRRRVLAKIRRERLAARGQGLPGRAQ
jgi:hypothetical protein